MHQKEGIWLVRTETDGNMVGYCCLIFLTTLEAAWYIISRALCLNVCNTITFESLDVGSSFSYIPYTSRR